MRTALEASPDVLDQQELTFVANVRKYGWSRTNVLGDAEGPAFSYTTGFWSTARAPELILFGMKWELVGDVFWNLFRDAQAGRALLPGARSDRPFENLPAYVFSVSSRRYRDYLGWNRWFYAGDDFPCQQIVWPDRAGRFPWEIGFDPTFAADQVDLTEDGWRAAIVE